MCCVWPAAVDDRQFVLGETFGDVVGGAVILVTGFGAGGAKNRDRQAGLGQRLK